MIPFRQARLLLQTLRYLESGQVAARCRHRLRRAFWKATNRRAPKPTVQRLTLHVPLYSGLRQVCLDGPWKEQARASTVTAEKLLRREFCFLNREVKFPSEIGWHDSSLSRLWRYHLHYFGYSDDLLIWSAFGNLTPAYNAFREIARSWMSHNDGIRGDGWHPYTISLRIVNWLNSLEGFAPQLDADPVFRTQIQASLRGQALILSGDLEMDVRGNHLLANLQALICYALVDSSCEAQRWMRSSLTLLKRELAEQVLPDGAHFERCPGYHTLVLKHCLEIAVGLQRKTGSAPQWLDDAVRRMLSYLDAILPPERRLPLLKDTTWDAPDPNALLAAGALYLHEPQFKRNDEFGIYPLLLFGTQGWEEYRKWPANTSSVSSAALDASRHFVVRDDLLGDYMIFDAGKPCPDYLPAHAHADLLSYELHVSGERIVVDSGVYEYSQGAWRDYFRSTRAHNTVVISDADQSQVWGSFRVARRARPGKMVSRLDDGIALVQGSHDGYMRLPAGVRHRRTVLWKADHFWLILDDVLGKGSTRATSHIHLHPNLNLAPLADKLWQITGSRSPLWIASFGAQSHSMIRGRMHPMRQGWYSEKFGELSSNLVLSMHRQGFMPFCFGYVVFKGTPGTLEFFADATHSRIVINQGGLESSLMVVSDGSPEFT